MFSSFLHYLILPPGSLGLQAPGRKASPVVFFMVSNTTKILRFYLERAECGTPMLFLAFSCQSVALLYFP